MLPLICMSVFTSCEGAFPLSNLLEICLQKGSILCMSLRVSFQSSVRAGGVFTLSLVDVGIVSAGVVLAVLHVLLQVWVAGPSGVDVTTLNSIYNKVTFNEKSAITKENLCTKYFPFTHKYVTLNEKPPITKQNLHIFFSL